MNAELPIDEVLGASFPICAAWATELRSLFAAYVEAKQRQNVLDYDDLLLYWAQAVSDPALADDIGGRFDHVMVDEYQDTNRLQSFILLALKPSRPRRHRGRCSFRAATVRNILDFPAAFSPPAEIVTLDRNYRSTQAILSAANGVIGLAAERFTKNLWTERKSDTPPQLVSVRDEADQARCIVERVLENREGGSTLKQQAVLFRTSHHSGPLEIELTRRNIPFVKFGGLKFLDAPHIKDLLALLRFVENPRDRVAGFRLMQSMQGVGPTLRNARSTTWTRPPTQSGRSSMHLRRPVRVTTGAPLWRSWPICGAAALACRTRTRAALVAASGTNPRGCRHASGRLDSARTDCQRISLAPALPDRADTRSAGRDQRPSGRALAR